MHVKEILLRTAKHFAYENVGQAIFRINVYGIMIQLVLNHVLNSQNVGALYFDERESSESEHGSKYTSKCACEHGVYALVEKSMQKSQNDITSSDMH